MGVLQVVWLFVRGFLAGRAALMTEYFTYYHEARLHLSLERNSPFPRPVCPPEQGKALGRRLLGEVCTLVTPGTILRGYRKLITRKYDGSCKRGWHRLPDS